RHGVRALTDGPLRDARHGGWRASTDEDQKGAYVQALGVRAGCGGKAAGVERGRELLAQALDVWQARFWDDDAGLVVEEWDRPWSRLDDYRGLNANMHGVEGSVPPSDALGGTDPPAAAL